MSVTFSTTGSLHTARELSEMVPLASGQVLVAGGDTGASQVAPTATAEVYALEQTASLYGGLDDLSCTQRLHWMVQRRNLVIRARATAPLSPRRARAKAKSEAICSIPNPMVG